MGFFTEIKAVRSMESWQQLSKTKTKVRRVAGTISGRDLYVMVETAIALSVASVPEGLPKK